MTIANINILIRFLTKTNSTIFTDAELLILVNNKYERIVGNLLYATMGGKWSFGDSNYTSLPTATGNLVNSQAEYQLSGDGSSTGFNTTDQLLTVRRVEVLDNDGINWQVLRPISLERIKREGQENFQSTDGLPLYYEKREDFLILYPAPDNGVSVTLTAGLKIFFSRTADIFTSAEVSTGTKEPGFPSAWHDVLAYSVAYEYALTNGLPNVNILKAEMDRKDQELLSFVTNRNEDDRPIIRPKPILFR